jgi:hypothetical protein
VPRVYLYCSNYAGYWYVQYLEAHLRTSLGPRRSRYTDLDRVREILRRADARTEAWEEFERRLRRWGIGACYLDLTDDQYAKLRVK